MTTGSDHPADPWKPTRLSFLALASAGDAGAVFHLASDLLGEGVPFPTILFEVLSPLEVEVGNRWHQGDFGVAEEHAVTAAVETVVALLAGSFDIPDDARRVVVACAEGDTHSLPARMVAAYLVFLGWRAVFLGPGQPATELGAYLRADLPEALVLSCTMVTALPGARACIRAAHEAGIPVLAGGPAFGPQGSRAYALGADAWTADPTRVDEILRTWQPEPGKAESGARDGGEDLLRLGRRRAELLARTEAALPKADTDADRARLRSDLELLVDTLAASLLLDDPEAIADLTGWQLSRPRASGVPDAAAVLQALMAVLGAEFPRAAALLDAAAPPPATR